MTDELPSSLSPQQYAENIEYSIGINRISSSTAADGFDNFDGFALTINGLVDSFEIHDSLDQMFRIAVMTLKDPSNYREVGPITGNEIISIMYRNALSTTEAPHKIINFRIFSVKEILNPSKPEVLTHKLIRLILVEYPVYDFLTFNQVYKTYPISDDNTPTLQISQIVKDILNEVPNLNKWCQLDIDDTEKENLNFYVPNWTPMKAINFLKKYATSDADQYPLYVFYTRNDDGSKFARNKPVLTFKSVYSLVDDSSVSRAYGLSQQHVDKKPINQPEEDDDTSIPEDTSPKSYSPLDILLSYEFEFFDASRMSFGDLSGQTQSTFDYLEDNMYFGSDYVNWQETKFKALTPYAMHSLKYGNQWSQFDHSGWHQKEAKKLLNQESYNKFSQHTLLGGLRCKAISRVFESRNPGERAELIIASGDRDRAVDMMMSGPWLTWSIIDKFDGSKAWSEIVFVKDSYTQIDDEFSYFKRVEMITGLSDLNSNLGGGS